MSMRVTQDVLYRNSLFYLQRGFQDVEKTQVPLLTGKKVNRPSDDPYGAVQIMKYREEQRGIKNYLANIQKADGIVEAGTAALQSLSNLLIEAREITVQGANSGLNQTDRDTLAGEIEHLIEEAMAIVNAEFGGRYLFGGSNTTQAPYAYDGQSLVAYHGNSEISYISISQGTRIAMNIPGPEIFQNLERGITVYQGNTGAAAGTGTDSGTANAVLEVLHGATTYAGASGIQPGTGSAAGDTIIGPAGAHTLTLSVNTPQTTGTVALDGGTPVWFDVTDPNVVPDPSNFEVLNADGDRVYLDLTGLTAGFSGTVDITSTGSLTLDGGATTVPITFSGNQVVQNSLDGSVTNVDTSGIVRTGQEYLTYSGSFDLFQMLMAIRDDLKNTRGLSEEEQLASIAGRLPELDDVHDDALSALSELGGRMLRLEMTENRLNDFDVKISGLLANIEDADLTQAILNLERANQSLQLAQAVAGQIIQSSILGQ